MNKEQLKSLRGQILNDIKPLAMNNGDATDRFGILLRIIQAGGATNETYNQAYEAARQIQDKDEQLNSLLALLDEVDFDVSATQPDTTGQQPTTDASASGQDAAIAPQQSADQSF